MVRALSAVADDLTGANGLGGRWAGRGSEVLVARDPAWLRAAAGCRILDVETRLLGPGAARTAARAAWTALGGAGLLFQKIDSTLRGNPAEEIEGLVLATAAPWVAVLPAYPALGRQVLQAALWVHGRRLDRTEYARDPLSPARAWRPQDLFPRDLRAHAPLSRVAAGLGSLRALLRRALDRGPRRPRFITFDCAESAQVQVIADACLAEGCRHFAGAADLGGALALRALGKASPVARPRALPWIVLAGSVSATTFGQLRVWREAGRPWQALAGRRNPDRMRLRRLLRSEGALALSSLDGRGDLAPWLEREARRGRGPARCAEDAMAGLARWGLAVAGGLDRCGWFVTGGHTLRALDEAAGIRTFSILGEVLPEVPLGLAQGAGGRAWMCSKPGGFGPADCFTRFMEAKA